jgi:hypothetical protein
VAAVKRLLPAAAIAVLLVSCSPVPFNAEFEAAAATVAKLNQDAGSTVTLDYDDNAIPDDLTFFPRVTTSGFDYSSGYTVGTDGAEIRGRSWVQDSSTGKLVPYGWMSETVPNQDARMPAWLAWPTKDAALSNTWVLLLTFDALYSDQNDSYALYETFLSSPPTTTVFQSGDVHGAISSTLGKVATLMGASVATSTSTSQDVLNMLVWDTSDAGWAELQSGVSSSGVSLSMLRTPTPALTFLPALPTHVQYYFDLNIGADASRTPNASFASWYDTASSSWVCYRWHYLASYFSTKLPIDHRIDALLTTGQLLSTEDGTGRLYDRDGNLLATFPLGSLRYIAEEYVGGEARTYFSQKLVYDNAIHFTVYWIATAKLATLGQ